MKKILMSLALIFSITTLVGCNNTDKDTKSNKESHPTKVIKKNNPINKTKKDDTKTRPLWTSEKNEQLSTFMNEFGSKMQQAYTEAKPGHDTNYAGLHYPSDFSKDNITIDGVRKNVDWSNNGTGSADVNVVDIYVNNDEATMGGHIYLFALVDKQPVVYHTDQNQDTGDHLTHFTTTENAELKDRFKAIVTGEKVKTTEESSKVSSGAIAAMVAQKADYANSPNLGYSVTGNRYVVNQGSSPMSIQFEVNGDIISVLPESRVIPNVKYSISELVKEYYTGSNSKSKTNEIVSRMTVG